MIWLLIGYMFLFIHRPFEVWPSLGTFRIELLYMLLTGTVWLVVARKGWIPNRQHVAYFAFVAALLASFLLSPWSAKCELTVYNYLCQMVFYVLLVTVVRDEQGLRRAALAFLVVMTLYMTHSLAEYINGKHVHRMGIGRMVGVDSSLGDPNSFGATVLYALPFVMPFWKSSSSPRTRWLLGGYVGLSVVCIALTGSRSSFVGLMLLGLMAVLRSHWRGRVLVLGLLLAPLLWALLPASLQTRFETIVNPEAGPANAQASARSRLDGLVTGLRLWEQNPLTGCGPGAWRPASGKKLEAHNLYGQLIGETGTLGALAFAAVLACFWLNLRRIREGYRLHPEWGQDFPCQAARAVGVALVLLLFMGNFGHNLYRYSWLWYGGFLIIARHCVEQRLAIASSAVDRHGWASWALPVPGLGRGMASV